jgi:hypothetical protein
MRMATFQVREGHVILSEMAWPILHRPRRVIGLGLAQLLVSALLVADLSIGMRIGGLFGAFLAVSAAYGLALLWTLAVVTWPLLLDPLRDDEPWGAQLRLAGLLIIARPVRHGLLALLLGVVVIVATITAAAIVTFALALVFLIAANDATAVADAWQGRAPLDREGEED